MVWLVLDEGLSTSKAQLVVIIRKKREETDIDMGDIRMLLHLEIPYKPSCADG